MKTRKFVSLLLLVLLLAFCAAPAAFAEVVVDSETISGEQDATVFLAGSDPSSTADIKGILFSAGNTVSASGRSEYAFIAGNTIALNGDCQRDAFMAGNSVGFSGSVGRDLLMAGQLLNLHGSVGRDLLAAGKTIILAGEIGGNVLLDADEIQIAEGTMINGTLRYNSNARITAPADILAQATVYENQHTDSGITVTEAKPASPLSGFKSKVFRFVGLLLIAHFLLWLTPLWEKLDSVYAEKIDIGQLAATFGIGIAVLIVLPIAAILLMITGFGLRPAFVLLFVYVAALLASPVFLSFILGVACWRLALKRARNYWAELAIGLLISCILGLIPYVKFAFGLISVGFGLGALTRLLGKKRMPPALPAQSVTE